MANVATWLVEARDQAGLVAKLAGFFANLGLNIVDAANHSDPHAEDGARFFMLLVVDLGGLASPGAAQGLGGSATRSSLESSFAALAKDLGATWSVRYDDVRPNVAVLVRQWR